MAGSLDVLSRRDLSVYYLTGTDEGVTEATCTRIIGLDLTLWDQNIVTA